MDIAYNQKFIYDELFNTLKIKTEFVETYPALEQWSLANGESGLFMKRHYSPTTNRIIAKEIFSFIQDKYPNFFTNSNEKK